MKFKKLYLHGFKSFVDKTSVDFPDGITAIVGPNGSGKSNIMDALRWVFGEQNAKELRGADMDDVVFNGSAKRKAAGFAEVGLTLSEIDESVAAKYGVFSEITVSRKFYKTGEREYHINGRKCRLKDIKDIFMDTGLGARSISIIEQGKVDKIINATPEELRFFLEETAGVTRFKDRKKEAEKRLAQTRENLDRVCDIIAEISSRRETLAAQVEVLKKSEELQSRKRALEKKFLCSSYKIRHDEKKVLESALAENKRNLASLIAEYGECVRRENVANCRYSDLQSANSALQERRLEAARSVAKSEGKVAALKDKLLSADKTAEDLENEIREAELKLRNAESFEEELKAALEKARQEKEEAENRANDMEDVVDDIKLRREDAESRFSEADAEYLEFAASLSELKNSLVRSETEEEHRSNALQRLRSEKKVLEESANTGESDLNSLKAEVELAAVALKEEEFGLSETDEKTKSAAKLVAECAAKVSELSSSLKNMKKNSLFFQEELSASYESEGASGITARREGKPLLDIFQGASDAVLSCVGDALLFKDAYKSQLLEEVKNGASSLSFAFEGEVEEIKNSFVDLPVEEVYPGLYRRGGLYRKAGEDDKSYKIIRLRERMRQEYLSIEETEKDLSARTEKAERLKKDLALLEDEKKRREKAVSELVRNSERLKASLAAARTESERNFKRLSTVEKEIELAERIRSEAESDALELKNKIRRLSETMEEAEEKRAALEDGLDFITGELEDKKDELRELRIELSEKNQAASAAAKELERNAALRSSLKENSAALKSRYERLINEDKASWQAELEAEIKNHASFLKELLTFEEELAESTAAMEELKTKIEGLRKEADSRNAAVKDAEGLIKENEVAIASVKASMEAAAAQYSEKFLEDLTISYAVHAEDNFQPKKAREEISAVDSELEKLGPLNLNAINDYNEAEERRLFLSDQKSDLEGSLADIESFISETDTATVKIFEETFAAVREQFAGVFHILFGGGEAELRLTDPDNVLTSGVEIYIQPPGKKLQHMGLLSGGEKALTALTLLFALFLRKPTPFCFLDEVDAPLDDANVERYTGMVKALSDRTQFVLITHNHNTMAIADSLYGVAMQEQGVSSILSVKLEQAAKAGR